MHMSSTLEGFFSSGGNETASFALHTDKKVGGETGMMWFAAQPGGELGHAAIFMEEGIPAVGVLGHMAKAYFSNTEGVLNEDAMPHAAMFARSFLTCIYWAHRLHLRLGDVKPDNMVLAADLGSNPSSTFWDMDGRRHRVVSIDHCGAMFQTVHYVRPKYYDRYQPTIPEGIIDASKLSSVPTTSGTGLARAKRTLCATDMSSGEVQERAKASKNSKQAKDSHSPSIPIGPYMYKLLDLHRETGCAPGSQLPGESPPIIVREMSRFGGTEGYLAPEAAPPMNQGGTNRAGRLLSTECLQSDIYSFGITMLSLFLGNIHNVNSNLTRILRILMIRSSFVQLSFPASGADTWVKSSATLACPQCQPSGSWPWTLSRASSNFSRLKGSPPNWPLHTLSWPWPTCTGMTPRQRRRDVRARGMALANMSLAEQSENRDGRAAAAARA